MLDYERLEREAIQENILKLRRELDAGKVPAFLKRKIQTFSKQNGLEPRLIQHHLLTDDLFFVTFAKQPIKQSFHQKCAHDYLQRTLGVDVKQLPSSGPSALFVVNGTTMPFANVGQSLQNTKSVDFCWEWIRKDGSVLKCFAAHKHTRDTGGAQDNQYKDLQAFMESCRASWDASVMFFAICDGDYYRRTSKNTDGMSKIEWLNAMKGGKRVVALPVEDIHPFLVAMDVPRE